MALDRAQDNGSGRDNARQASVAPGIGRPFAVGPQVGASPGETGVRDKSGKYVFRVSELRWILDKIKRLVDDLEQAMTVLPHVKEDGSSECSFAGELYGKKEELEEEVKDAIQRMQSYDADLAREIRRLKENQGRIRADANKLGLPETQDHYNVADEAAQKEYRKLVQDREAIAVVMAKAQGVLQVSRRRKMPGGAPPASSPVSSGTSKVHQPPGSAPGPGPLDKGLDGLISLGPLGQIPGRK